MSPNYCKIGHINCTCSLLCLLCVNPSLVSAFSPGVFSGHLIFLVGHWTSSTSLQCVNAALMLSFSPDSFALMAHIWSFWWGVLGQPLQCICSSLVVLTAKMETPVPSSPFWTGAVPGSCPPAPSTFLQNPIELTPWTLPRETAITHWSLCLWGWLVSYQSANGNTEAVKKKIIFVIVLRQDLIVQFRLSWNYRGLALNFQYSGFHPSEL